MILTELMAQLPWQVPPLPAALPSVTLMKEIALGVAAAITLWGIRLSWTASDDQMSIEESVKDGRLTDEQARRKIRQLAWFGPLVTLAGVTFLCAVLLQ